MSMRINIKWDKNVPIDVRWVWVYCHLGEVEKELVLKKKMVLAEMHSPTLAVINGSFYDVNNLVDALFAEAILPVEPE